VAVETEVPDAQRRSGRAALGDTWRALRAVFRKPSLRRMQLALAASLVGDWAFSTAVTVWAYREGGAQLVGLWAGVRLALIAVATPLGASVVDRLSRKSVLLVSTLVRSGLVVAAVVALVVDAPAWAVLVLATMIPLVGCVFRPAQLAWLPSLTSHPGELTAANGASSTIDSLAFLIGPAIGGLVVATTSVETMFVITAVMFLVAAGLVARIDSGAGGRRDAAVAARPDRRLADSDAGLADGPPNPAAPPEDAARAGLLRDMASGFTTIGHDGNLVMVMVLICAQMVVSGAMVVLGVVFAVDVLGTGPAGVGLIDSVLGIGAVVGGFVAIARSVRNKIALDLVTGTMLWSLPLLLVVAAPSPATVFAMVAIMGFGLPLVDVNYATLTMRLAPDERLGRVFGAFEGTCIGAMALGSAVTPFLLDHLGMRGVLGLLSVVVGVPAIAYVRRARRLDASLRPPPGTDLLAALPMFSPLAPASLEFLARRLVPTSVPAGTAIVREGEASDRFYLVVRGRVEVTQGGRPLRIEGPGEFFGEIGLLRNVPRTATVTAVDDTELVSLVREDFLGAVQGTDASMAAAYDIVTSRLG
jgi:predicted MFS family arabinose efflux permease